MIDGLIKAFEAGGYQLVWLLLVALALWQILFKLAPSLITNLKAHWDQQRKIGEEQNANFVKLTNHILAWMGRIEIRLGNVEDDGKATRGTTDLIASRLQVPTKPKQ